VFFKTVFTSLDYTEFTSWDAITLDAWTGSYVAAVAAAAVVPPGDVRIVETSAGSVVVQTVALFEKAKPETWKAFAARLDTNFSSIFENSALVEYQAEVRDVRTPESGGSKEFMAGPVRTIFSVLLAALLLALVVVAIRYRLQKNKKRMLEREYSGCPGSPIAQFAVHYNSAADMTRKSATESEEGRTPQPRLNLSPAEMDLETPTATEQCLSAVLLPQSNAE